MNKEEFYALKSRYEVLGQKLIFEDLKYTIVESNDFRGNKREYIILDSMIVRDKYVKIPEFMIIHLKVI